MLKASSNNAAHRLNLVHPSRSHGLFKSLLSMRDKLIQSAWQLFGQREQLGNGDVKPKIVTFRAQSRCNTLQIVCSICSRIEQVKTCNT
jgi:hypothetical protein